jgi:hypothetical protein
MRGSARADRETATLATSSARFFEDEDLNFVFLIVLGGAYDRVADVGTFWPGQPQQLYDALPGPKTLVKFTEAEGADLHCEPKTPGLRAQRIFDWLDGTLAARGRD